jgi:hypothetical protein
MKAVVEHNLPVPKKGAFTLHICTRGIDSPSNVIVRKFKSSCGNTLEVHVTSKSGYIRSITPLDDCPQNCMFCRERIEIIKNLIAREHQIY